MHGTIALNGVTLFEWDVTLHELLIKLLQQDAIIMYGTRINNNRISHLYCKNMQTIYLELQNVQNMLHRSKECWCDNRHCLASL